MAQVSSKTGNAKNDNYFPCRLSGRRERYRFTFTCNQRYGSLNSEPWSLFASSVVSAKLSLCVERNDIIYT